MREENGEKKLHFRRLADTERSALPSQEEIKGVDADSVFATSRQVVAAAAAMLLRRAPGGSSSGMTAGLRQFGLGPALTADIVRQAWVARSADDAPNANRHIAKIKVDDVTFRDTGGRTRRHAEIEITGLEDEEGSPEYVGEDAFRIFMYGFRQTYARRISRGRRIPELHIGTKYDAGLRLFDRIDDSVADFRGEALVRQEPVFSDFEPEARSGLLRTVLFGFVSSLAADLVGLIGFPLTVLGLPALNSRETSA